MWNSYFGSFLKILLIWLYFSFHQLDANDFSSLNSSVIKEVLYYHNIYRYLVTVGNIQGQPPASDMTMIRWNGTLAKVVQDIPSECILLVDKPSCPQINVYYMDDQGMSIAKILRKWFNGYRYYNYVENSCDIYSCKAYKRIVESKTHTLGCAVKRIGKNMYFVCYYSRSNTNQPYKTGKPCSSCPKDFEICFKDAFCTSKNECKNEDCESLLTKSEYNLMQADSINPPKFCILPRVDCSITFYKHMCPLECIQISTSTISTSTERTVTTQLTSFSDNEVCKVVSVDCSIPFFKILCKKTCEEVLCRDPNIDCRNIFYTKCQKCQQFDEKMSDSKITSTTIIPYIDIAIGLYDPKCQDLQYENYCIDRGEMCFHSFFQVWMKRFCCNTCKILDVCFDYLEMKSPGKCAEMLSSGMCMTSWSQTYCKKTCQRC